MYQSIKWIMLSLLLSSICGSVSAQLNSSLNNTSMGATQLAAGDFTSFVTVGQIAVASNLTATSADWTGSIGFITPIFTEEADTTTTTEPLAGYFSDKVSVYPNPTAQTLFVKTTGHSQNIRLFDNSGKELDLLSIEKNKDLIELDLSDLNSGIYLLKLEGTDETQLFRFMKQ